MGIEDQLRRTVHRFHDEIGHPVRLETFVETGEQDSHGHPITESYETETQAEVVFRGTPVFSRERRGLDADIQAVAYIKDDVEIPISGIDDADGSEATRIHILDETGGTPDTLAVFTAHSELNGKVRLHCVNFDG